MFRKIMVAFDDSPQANYALEVSIELAKQFKTGLHIITVSEPLPLYTAMIDAQVPGGQRMLLRELKTYYLELQIGAVAKASAAGLDVQGLVIEGKELPTIVDRIAEYNPDLLVLGRRHHSTISGLWSGTVHNIAEKVRCNIWRFIDDPSISTGSGPADVKTEGARRADVRLAEREMSGIPFCFGKSRDSEPLPLGDA